MRSNSRALYCIRGDISYGWRATDGSVNRMKQVPRKGWGRYLVADVLTTIDPFYSPRHKVARATSASM